MKKQIIGGFAGGAAVLSVIGYFNNNHDMAMYFLVMFGIFFLWCAINTETIVNRYSNCNWLMNPQMESGEKKDGEQNP